LMSALPSTLLRRIPRSATTLRTFTTSIHNHPSLNTKFNLPITVKSICTSHIHRMPRHESQDQGESTEGINEWKKRAPYRIHDKQESFDVKYEANCHCGKVEYELCRDEPLDSKLCHCTTCQVQHAAPFQWAAIFHKEDINFTRGHHDLEWYDPSTKSVEHKLPCKVRCSFCHSPIMDEGRNMILLFPSLVHLKTDEAKRKFKPRCHMFYGQRVMDIPDGLPKWSGLPGESELIEDSPREEVQKLERKRTKELEEGKEKKEEEEKK